MLSYFLVFVVSLYCLGLVSSMLTVRSLNRKGYTYMKYTNCFNPVLWISFVYGFSWKLLVPQHVMEQLLLRYYDGFCKPNCYDSEDGKCVHCGCDAVAKAASPFSECAAGYWGHIIFRRKVYEKVRKEFPVTITAKYGKH